MRIAYFSDNFYPEISGIPDSIITTGEELRKRGHEVVYVAPKYSAKDYAPVKKYGTDGKLIPDPKMDLPVHRLPSLRMPNSPTGQSRFVIPIGTSISYLRKFKPDIIHTQSPYGTGLEAVLVSKILKVPLVGTNHTPIEEFVHYAPGGKYYEGLARKYDAWYYNFCKFVTAPYQGLIDNMRTQGLTAPGRGQANPVPFNTSPKSEAEKNACKVGMDIHGPMILVSGRLAPEKKVDVVLQAFAEIERDFLGVKLVITGHGSDEERLKNIAKKLLIENSVRFVGFVNPAKLEELYCTADMYVIMSTAETQSLSLMQSFASGVPAIAAHARGLVDYCPPECGLQVEPGNVDELVKNMRILLNDPALRTRLGMAGVEFVKKFTPSKIADDWEEIYKQFII